jgi:LemA protein
MKKTLLIIGAFAALVIGSMFIMMGVENTAISYEEDIENAASYIRVEEKRRFDLIPNLIETVKEYDKHEYETLVAAVEARKGDADAGTVEEIKTMIAAVAEAYPDLKSQKNYQELMNELTITENKIADIRKFYNKQVTDYKRFVRVFPNKQILRLRGYEVKEFERLEFENTSTDAPKDLFK